MPHKCICHIATPLPARCTLQLHRPMPCSCTGHIAPLTACIASPHALQLHGPHCPPSQPHTSCCHMPHHCKGHIIPLAAAQHCHAPCSSMCHIAAPLQPHGPYHCTPRSCTATSLPPLQLHSLLLHALQLHMLHSSPTPTFSLTSSSPSFTYSASKT